MKLFCKNLRVWMTVLIEGASLVVLSEEELEDDFVVFELVGGTTPVIPNDQAEIPPHFSSGKP